MESKIQVQKKGKGLKSHIKEIENRPKLEKNAEVKI